LEITSYISINLLLFSSWYIFLYRKTSCLSFADRLIGTFISGLTQIIATEMILGVIFKKLFPFPLFLFNAGISASVISYVLLSGGCRGLLCEVKDETARIFAIIYKDRVLLCIFILFVLSVCRLVFLGYLFPSFSWDALYYHLPITGQILQSGAIQESSNPSFIQQYMNIFSKNINLFFLWNIIFLKSDVIVDLSQLVFALAGVLSIYSMAMKLKIAEKYAIYSSLLFFFTPVLILQSTANYVDVALSMLFLAAVNFLIHEDTETETDVNDLKGALYTGRAAIVLAGLSAGILLGSKPTGPLFIAVMAGGIFMKGILKKFVPAGAVSNGKGYGRSEWFKTYLVYFMLPVLCAGGYWYIRNWLFYGNPVYYMDVSVLNVTLLKGLESNWVEPSPEIIENLNYVTGLFYVWLERVDYYMYDSRLSGFGPIWFVLFLPSMMFSVIYAVIKKKYSFLFVCAILAVTFLIHPRNWTTRYVVFIVGLGALSFGVMLNCFSKREKVLTIIALLLAGYTFLTVNSPCIMPGKIMEFLALPAEERTLSRHKPFNIDVKVRKEYGYWIWIDNHIAGGDTLAYTFESFELNTSEPFFTAPLWNREFSNNVLYVKSNTYKEWLKELKENNADYVLVRKNSTEDAWIEKERRLFYSLNWMGSMKEKFRIVYEDENYKIAAVMRDKK
jgi:hypothetical protein